MGGHFRAGETHVNTPSSSPSCFVGVELIPGPHVRKKVAIPIDSAPRIDLAHAVWFIYDFCFRVKVPILPIKNIVTLIGVVEENEKKDFSSLMAKLIFEVIEGGPKSQLAKELMITDPFKGYGGIEQIDFIIFSGGVSEHIYEHDQNSYGDMGPLLAKSMREHLSRVPKKDILRESTEGIRATVIGAGEYTIQASGNTSYISNRDCLPAFGLKVVRPFIEEEESVEQAVRTALAKFDLSSYGSGLALAVSLPQQPDYQSIRNLAEGIAAVVKESNDTSATLYLTLDLDVAKSLGGVLKEELKIQQEVIAVDGIDVGDLDYVDIGLPMGISEVIPVTVKSLMFPSNSSD